MYRNKKNVSKIRPFTRNSNRVLATWCALAVLALLLPLCLAAGTRRAGAPAGPAPAGSGPLAAALRGTYVAKDVSKAVLSAVASFSHDKYSDAPSTKWKWPLFRELFDTTVYVAGFSLDGLTDETTAEYKETSRFLLGLVTSLFTGAALKIILGMARVYGQDGIKVWNRAKTRFGGNLSSGRTAKMAEFNKARDNFPVNDDPAEFLSYIHEIHTHLNSDGGESPESALVDVVWHGLMKAGGPYKYLVQSVLNEGKSPDKLTFADLQDRISSAWSAHEVSTGANAWGYRGSVNPANNLPAGASAGATAGAGAPPNLNEDFRKEVFAVAKAAAKDAAKAAFQGKKRDREPSNKQPPPPGEECKFPACMAMAKKWGRDTVMHTKDNCYKNPESKNSRFCAHPNCNKYTNHTTENHKGKSTFSTLRAMNPNTLMPKVPPGMDGAAECPANQPAGAKASESYRPGRDTPSSPVPGRTGKNSENPPDLTFNFLTRYDTGGNDTESDE